MLPVSPAFESAITSDSRNVTYRVKLGGAIVLDKSVVTNMVLNESVSSGSGLVAGSSNAAELTLTLRNPDVLEYKGMLVEPESGLVLPDGSTEWVPLGRFWVTNVSTTNDYQTVKLTCADGMYLLSGEYVSNLEYPTSIRAVVHEIISQAGVEFVEPDSWPQVIVRVKPEKLTLRNAIGYAAGCCGKNARFNRQGQLEFTWYTDTGVVIERGMQYLDGMVKLHDKPLQVNFEVSGAKEKYECIILCDKNGSVNATPSKGILEGDTVSLSVRADSGYALDSITAVDAFGKKVALVEDAEGAGYTFIQPDSNVTVTASFKDTSGGPFRLTVRSGGNGSITYAASDTEHEEGYDYFDAGEEVALFVTPNEGFAVSSFATTPAGLVITKLGSSEDGEDLYSFIMPNRDVDITVYFGAATEHAITWEVVHDHTHDTAYVTITNETSGRAPYNTGDSIVIDISVISGYELDRVEGNVSLTQIDENSFRFTMPDHNVHFVVYTKQASGEDQDGSYSFLQSPSYAQPPLSKPYWAVFYNYVVEDSGNLSSGVSEKYMLVWFDSWSASGASDYDGEKAYTVKLKGYYYCRSREQENQQHSWYTTWYGNGSANSSITLNVPLKKWHTGDCLVATNANLYLNGSTLIFQKNDTAIGDVQTDWREGGIDIREAGALTFFPCPDTYTTPPPRRYWMMLDYCYVYKPADTVFASDYVVGVNGKFSYLFFDSVEVENLGEYYSGRYIDIFKLTFQNAVVVRVNQYTGELSSEQVVDEPCYILIQDPQRYMSGFITGLGILEHCSGLRASNFTFNENGLVFYNNSPIICNCDTPVRTFSMRSASPVHADTVTLTYTNPLIYEKAASSVQEVIQGMTYTPAKVKHRGNPAIQAGDIVTVPDGKGEDHTVLIMQQTMTFGGGMNSEITCPGQTEETASFNSQNLISVQIKDEITKVYSEMSHEGAAQSAAVISAIYATITSVRFFLESSIKSVAGDVVNVSEEVTRIEQRLSQAENAISGIDGRCDAIETELSYLDKDLSDVQAAVKALEEAAGNEQADIDAISATLTALDEAVDALLIDVEGLQSRVETLEARVDALEDKTDLGDLKRQLADTDKQIAHCAEIFMLEVMVNGTEPAAVVLPYDISELHNTRVTLRANIAALEEVQPNE